ncbi:MAG: sugar transferase [Actinomycetota bacterium]
MAVIESGSELGRELHESTRRPRVGRSRMTLAALDAIAVLGAISVASTLTPDVDATAAAVVLLLASIVWLSRARLYQARFITLRTDEIRRIVDAGVRSAITVAMAEFLLDVPVDRRWLATTTVVGIVLLSTGREFVRRRFDARRAAGAMTRRVLLIGDNEESERFTRMFADEPRLGYEVVGRIDPDTGDEPHRLTTRVLAEARRSQAFGVIVLATAVGVRDSNRLARDLVEAGIHVELSSTLADISFDRLTVRPLGRYPVFYIEPRLRRGWRAAAKRTFDVVLAGAALLVAAPLLIAIALAVKLGSPGPVLFRQERVGKDGVPFQVLKFRTMVVDAEERLAELQAANEGAGPLFKMKHDPRVTRAGAVLRKTSLDELPQLWNVLRNEMSLVGPRPALQSEMQTWSEDLYGRLRVKPGITGMWQVSGRSSTTFEEYTRLDLYYVDNWSLVIDVSILARTIPAVLARSGAY